MKERTILNILLIGAGKFGKNHIKVLKTFEESRKINFLGVVVNTRESQEIISKKYSLNVWTELNEQLLKQADAVMIVTPPETHYNLVKKCLEHTNVFVEKPLTESYSTAKELAEYADKNSKILMVGHIFRFHPVVKKLKEIIHYNDCHEKLVVNGMFTNPINTDNGRDISLEMLHLFDVLDYIFGVEPSLAVARSNKRVHEVSLRYPNNMDAILNLGWAGEEKKRTLEFIVPYKKQIISDLSKNTITIINLEDNKVISREEITCNQNLDLLEEEITAFIKTLQKKIVPYPDAKTCARIVKIANSIKLINAGERQKTVAIIGGGIFGTNCAIELGKKYDITVFERNDDLLREASFINQYRHHWGYHYPRSVDTVTDIKNSMVSFEALYNKAVIRNFPTYYCVAKEGSNVTAEEYIKFCEDNDLPFTIDYPDPAHVDRGMISTSLKTLEPIYDYNILYKLINSYLSNNKNIKVELNSEVIDGSIEKDGKKTLIIKKENTIYEKKFDFVINVTYANLNKFTYWFNFPIKMLRIGSVEALIVKLPIPKLSFAIFDGPFTNLVPTSEDNTFTLVHIRDSILHRKVPEDGLIPESWYNQVSNKEKIIEESKKWLPILEKAEVLESRYVFRGVNAYREFDDARPSDIIHHGFGCWSVLGGKIINSVSTARKIFNEINNNI